MMATAELSSPDADLPGPHPMISPYGERLSKFHVTTEYPKHFAPQKKRHPRRKLARYKTQPITFTEIKEVDELDAVGEDPKSPKSPTARELKCPEKMEALNAAIARTLDKLEKPTETVPSYRRQVSLQRSAEI